MKNSRTFALVSIVAISLVSTVSTSGRILPHNSTNQHLPLIGEMKVLAEGPQSAIQEAFVAVCRDAETYQALKKLDHNLPKVDGEFFQSHVVIAAYLGTRNTGGYGVEIERKGDPDNNLPSPDRTRFEVIEKSPPKGGIVPQVITSPFKIVSLEVNGAPPLILTLGYAWRQKQQLYRIKSGSFGMGGGFAGTSEAFVPHGEWLMSRARGLVSFCISMRGTGGSKERFLSDFATGILDKDAVTIKKLTADFFVDGANAGFSGAGTLREREGKLSLSFSSLRAIVSDGYGGGGTLEAELVESPVKP